MSLGGLVFAQVLVVATCLHKGDGGGWVIVYLEDSYFYHVCYIQPVEKQSSVTDNKLT